MDYKWIKPWKRMSNYIGADWTGWYAAPVGQSRDSDTVERSNWAAQLEEIPESDTVQVVRENHWAVGWVEWLAIRADDEAALKAAEEIGERIDTYPILDEDAWSKLEWEENPGEE